VPAAAVIPAPRAYINVVAVKKPVVGFEDASCIRTHEGFLDCGRVRFGGILTYAGLFTGRSFLNW
jgi:hypothetical protein